MKQTIPALHHGGGTFTVNGNTRVYIKCREHIIVTESYLEKKKPMARLVKLRAVGEHTYYATFVEKATLNVICADTTPWEFQVEEGKWYKKLSDKKVEVPVPLQVDNREAQLKAMLAAMVEDKLGANQIDSVEDMLDYDIDGDGEIAGTSEIMDEDEEMELKNQLLNPTPDEAPAESITPTETPPEGAQTLTEETPTEG